MRLFAGLVAASLVLATPAFAQPKPPEPTKKVAANRVDLRPRFTKGQEVRFKLALDSKQTGGDSEQNTSTTQEVGVLLRCKDANPETGPALDLVYESLKLKVKMGETDVVFDSTTKPDPDDPIDGVLRSMVGTTVPVTMDKDGNISALGGAGAGLGALTGGASGADVIKSMMGPIFTTTKGDGRAAVGEFWTTEDTMQGAAGVMTLKFTHTLTSHRGGRAVIDTKGTVKLDPSSAGKAAIRDSSITARTQWDTEKGMLESMESRQKLTMQTTGDAASTTTHEMNVKVTRGR